jgi:hypothetical protein
VSDAVVGAWQDALAAEQQAAFGYALLGPQLRRGDQDRARTCQALHEDLRDRTAGGIAATGHPPAAPAADYPGLYGIAPRALAAQLEEDCAAAWRFLYAQAAASSGPEADRLRRTAQQALTASAVRATRWRVLAGAARPVVPFPGAH